MAGTDTIRLFKIPLNRSKYPDTVSQFCARALLGISVKECTISEPLLVAFTIMSAKGIRHITARRIRMMYNILFFAFAAISVPSLFPAVHHFKLQCGKQEYDDKQYIGNSRCISHLICLKSEFVEIHNNCLGTAAWISRRTAADKERKVKHLQSADR